MTDFLSDLPDTKTDTRKPWITPEIKELAGAQDAQGGVVVGSREVVSYPYTNYRPS